MTYAVQFNGSSGFESAAAIAAVTSGGLTFFFYYQSGSLSTFGGVSDIGGSSGGGGIGNVQNHLANDTIGESNGGQTIGTIASTTQWYYIACTWAVGGAEIYYVGPVQGAIASTYTAIATGAGSFDNPTLIYFGSDGPGEGDGYSPCSICEGRIFNIAMTPTQIQTEGASPTPVLTGNLIHYWMASTQSTLTGMEADQIGTLTLSVEAGSPTVVAGPTFGPVINSQPTSASALIPTGTATFSVTATSSSGSLSYQWYLNGASISGATSSSYTVTVTGLGVTGSYTCGVTDSNGTNTTNAAILIGYWGRGEGLGASAIGEVAIGQQPISPYDAPFYVDF